MITQLCNSCETQTCRRCKCCHTCDALSDPIVRECIELGERQPVIPEVETVRCHCGELLHYNDKFLEIQIKELVALKGRYVRVAVGDDEWLVCRHYIALHGIKAQELPTLGFAKVPSQ